jgi:hypothetical protein
MRGVASLGIVSLALGCGGSPPPAPPATPTSAVSPGDGVLRPITQGQLKVAHYATGDGVVGLVLDRTGKNPKVRIDGEKDIIELTMEEDRFGGERRGWYLKRPDGRNMLYLGEGGSLKLFKGADELYLNSDKPADPLPAATIAGEYHRPKSAYDIAVEHLTPLSVLKRFDQFKPEDSGNLAKVSDAYGVVTPEMFVHVTERGAKEAAWAPASSHIGNVHQGLGGRVGLGPSDDAWDKSKPGLAKYGGVLVPMRVEYNSGNRLRMHKLKGWPPPLAVGTPGIIWEVDNGTVVLVTLDGGRYEISIGNDDSSVVEPGAGQATSWPPPLQHTLVDVDSVRGFAKGGAVADTVGKDMETLDDAWFNCINDLWKATKTQVDQVEASTASMNDKMGRETGIVKSAELKAPTQCASAKAKLDAGLVKFIEARNAERMTLFAKARSRAQ